MYYTFLTVGCNYIDSKTDKDKGQGYLLRSIEERILLVQIRVLYILTFFVIKAEKRKRKKIEVKFRKKCVSEFAFPEKPDFQKSTA